MANSSSFAFKRPPRIIPPLPQLEVEIPAPPVPRSAKGFLSGLRGVLGGLGLAVTSLGFGIISLFTGQVAYALMGITGFLLSLTATSLGWLIQKRGEKDEQNRYKETLRVKQSVLEEYRRQQQMVLNGLNPAVHLLGGIVNEAFSNPRSHLWERRASDPDFLQARLGAGKQTSSVKLRLQPPEPLAPLANEARTLANEYQNVPYVPGVVNLPEIGALGVTGDSTALAEFGQALLMHLTTYHSPEDLQIQAVYPISRTNDWFWLGWLPHAQADIEGQPPLLACEGERVENLLDDLYELLANRENKLSPNDHSNKNPASQFAPRIVLLVDNRDTLGLRDDIILNLINRGKTCGIYLIFLANAINDLPENCGGVAQLRGKNLHYSPTNAPMLSTQWEYDRANTAMAEDFGRTIAPLELASSPTIASFPSSIRLFDITKTPDKASLSQLVGSAWQQKSARLGVPIGVRASGKPIALDITDGVHGPHGLLAGTTGSGKSELLITLLTSLALHNDPYKLNFVLIDFKADVEFKALKNLPHTAGYISNLDGKLAERALVSLERELARRQELFDRVGVSHIKAYQNRPQDTPLPYLLIVVDEFAQLVQSAGDFVEKLVGIGRVGRTLGVYLLLATQDPARVVSSEIKTNTNYKICLRVQTDEISSNILDRREAARIPLAARGRGYLKVGNEVFEQFQTARVLVEQQNGSGRPKDRWLVSYDQAWQPHEVFKRQSGAEVGDGVSLKDSDMAIEVCMEMGRRINFKPLPRPWLEPLPDTISLASLLGIAKFRAERGWPQLPLDKYLRVPIALEDWPSLQEQPPLMTNLAASGGSLLIAGAGGSGRSTLLRTTLMSLAWTHSPAMLEFRLVDYDNGGLSVFEKLPHELSFLSKDSVAVTELFRDLQREIDERKAIWGKLRFDNWPTYYQKQTASGLSAKRAIVLAIDNWAALKRQPDFYGEEAFLNLVREGQRYGVYIVLTTDRSYDVDFDRMEAWFQTLYLRMAKDHIPFMDDPTYKSWRNVPGRGFRDGKAIGKRSIEFQVALTVDAAPADQLDTLATRISDMALQAKRLSD